MDEEFDEIQARDIEKGRVLCARDNILPGCGLNHAHNWNILQQNKDYS